MQDSSTDNRPPKPANTTQDARKILVLNEKVQFDKDGVQCHDSPYVWLGDICQKRKDLFLPDKHGDCAIADPRKKSFASPIFSAMVLTSQEPCLYWAVTY